MIFFVFTAYPSKITFLQILNRHFSKMDIFKNVHFQKVDPDLFCKSFYFRRVKLCKKRVSTYTYLQIQIHHKTIY